jgi:hypothetical protein
MDGIVHVARRSDCGHLVRVPGLIDEGNIDPSAHLAVPSGPREGPIRGRAAPADPNTSPLGRLRGAMASPAAYEILGGYGPFDGGCLETARAALGLAPGAELWVTGPEGAPPDHAFLRHWGWCWDADGAQTEAEMERKVRQDGHRGEVAFHTRPFTDCPPGSLPDDPDKVRQLRELMV